MDHLLLRTSVSTRFIWWKNYTTPIKGEIFKYLSNISIISNKWLYFRRSPFSIVSTEISLSAIVFYYLTRKMFQFEVAIEMAKGQLETFKIREWPPNFISILKLDNFTMFELCSTQLLIGCCCLAFPCSFAFFANVSER